MQSLTKGSYERVIKQHKNKLLCIFFKKNNDPFTVAAEGVFDSLAASKKYPRTIFYQVSIDEEKELAESLKIKEFGYAVFIVNSEVKLKYPVMMPNKIEDLVKKYEPEEYVGVSHTIQGISNQDDFFSKISAMKQEKAAEEPEKKAHKITKPDPIIRSESEEERNKREEEERRKIEEEKIKMVAKQLTEAGFSEKDGYTSAKWTLNYNECVEMLNKRSEMRNTIDKTFGKEAVEAFNILLEEFVQEKAFSLVDVNVRTPNHARKVVKARLSVKEELRRRKLENERNMRESREEQMRIEKELLRKQREKNEILNKIKHVQRINSTNSQKDAVAKPKSTKSTKCKVNLNMEGSGSHNYIMTSEDTMESLIDKFRHDINDFETVHFTFVDTLTNKSLDYSNDSTLGSLGITGFSRFFVKKETE